MNKQKRKKKKIIQKRLNFKTYNNKNNKIKIKFLYKMQKFKMIQFNLAKKKN